MRTELSYPLSPRASATRLAVGFVLWSAIWVIGSDYLVDVFVPKLGFWLLQAGKGLIYVAVSVLIMWLSVLAIEKDEAGRRIRNESKLQRLRESGLIGVASRTASGRFDYVNETMAQMLGYEYHDLVGMESGKLVPAAYQDLKEKTEIQLREFGRSQLFEAELIRKDRSLVPVLGGRAKVAGTTGEEINYFVDITDLRRSEQERKRLQEQLLQSEKINAVGQLAGGIAHDFNNELAIIIGYASLLEERLAEDEVARAQTDHILKSAERARKLIRQLLMFSRKQPSQTEVIDLNRTIAEMESMLRPLLSENIDLRIYLSDEKLYIEIEPSQFQQILLNLVVNARDAMPFGGVLTITLGHSEIRSGEKGGSRQFVNLEVSDTGTGIDEAIKSRIFDPFFTTKEQSGGCGLGLAVVHGIVQQCDGEIHLTSQPGRGSSFLLKFPRAVPGVQREAQPSVQTAARLSGTVLLAEDLDDLREMLTQILSQKGLHVLAASDGINAVKVANETKGTIDLIVTDVLMPRMNGPDAVRRIRESRPSVKVVYLSGYTESVVPEGSDLLLAKPIAPEVLVQAVQNCLVGTTPQGKSAQMKDFAA
jgi:PAS domain S-box-containing protein